MSIAATTHPGWFKGSRVPADRPEPLPPWRGWPAAPAVTAASQRAAAAGCPAYPEPWTAPAGADRLGLAGPGSWRYAGAEAPVQCRNPMGPDLLARTRRSRRYASRTPSQPGCPAGLSAGAAALRDAQILALRHDVAVLRHQGARPEPHPADRAVAAALAPAACGLRPGREPGSLPGPAPASGQLEAGPNASTAERRPSSSRRARAGCPRRRKRQGTRIVGSRRCPRSAVSPLPARLPWLRIRVWRDGQHCGHGPSAARCRALAQEGREDHDQGQEQEQLQDARHGNAGPLGVISAIPAAFTVVELLHARPPGGYGPGPAPSCPGRGGETSVT